MRFAWWLGVVLGGGLCGCSGCVEDKSEPSKPTESKPAQRLMRSDHRIRDLIDSGAADPAADAGP